ncbi:hypothetical protein EDB87DRAFT_1821314 [Lactarius vividus]|nr:hypothetical protein EDB87DRAFT_1821314 [Lactarius vividus]
MSTAVAILQQARDVTPSHQPTEIRKRMSDACAGKTLPFVLPLLARPEMMVVILSPLDALELDQEYRFRKVGLRAKDINGKTYNNTSEQGLYHHDFMQGVFQVVITSPEMCLKHPEFWKSLEDTSISKRIAAFTIDEAHCITRWGDKFRDAHASIGTLLTSATLTPQDITAIQNCVLMRQESTLHLNLGNIFWKVLHMEGGKSDLEALSFLLPDKDAPVNTQKLERGLIFFDDIFLSMTARRWFQEHLPQHLQDRVRCYNSWRVQFMTPDSLSVWLQRAGRAGRQSGISAKAYLLVQPSVFQEVKKKNQEGGEVMDYKKAVEDALREWVETESCPCDVVNKWFNNPGPYEDSRLLGNGTSPPQSPDTPVSLLFSSPPPSPVPSDQSGDNNVLSDVINRDGKRPMCEGLAQRRDEVRKQVREVLFKWRDTKWGDEYSHCPWGPEGLLPDTVLTAKCVLHITIPMHPRRWLYHGRYQRLDPRLTKTVPMVCEARAKDHGSWPMTPDARWQLAIGSEMINTYGTVA